MIAGDILASWNELGVHEMRAVGCAPRNRVDLSDARTGEPIAVLTFDEVLELAAWLETDAREPPRTEPADFERHLSTNEQDVLARALHRSVAVVAKGMRARQPSMDAPGERPRQSDREEYDAISNRHPTWASDDVREEMRARRRPHPHDVGCRCDWCMDAPCETCGGPVPCIRHDKTRIGERPRRGEPPDCCEWRDEYKLVSAKLDAELARNIHPQEHDFVPGDESTGWGNQCAQPVFEGGARRHCGYPCDAHRTANRAAPGAQRAQSEPALPEGWRDGTHRTHSHRTAYGPDGATVELWPDGDVYVHGCRALNDDGEVFPAAVLRALLGTATPSPDNVARARELEQRSKDPRCCDRAPFHAGPCSKPRLDKPTPDPYTDEDT